MYILLGAICLGTIITVFLQILNRQELLAQRDDIEMMRFRLKTIMNDVEFIRNNTYDDNSNENEQEDALEKETSENQEDFNNIILDKENILKESDFEFHHTDDKIEYEEENFTIEEE